MELELCRLLGFVGDGAADFALALGGGGQFPEMGAERGGVGVGVLVVEVPVEEAEEGSEEEEAGAAAAEGEELHCGV